MGTLPLSAPPPRGTPTTAATDRGGRRFRRLALTLLAGGILLLAAVQVVEWAGARARRAIASQLERVLLAGLGAEAGSVSGRSLFVVDSGGEPTEESLQRFASEFASRYGTMKRLSITSLSPGSEDLEMVAAATLHAMEEDVVATVRFRLVPGSLHGVALVGIEAMDRRRGDLAIGELGGYARAARVRAEP